MDVVLAGGAEAPLAALVFASFDRLRMMPTSFNEAPAKACRPFSADREGMVMGEGAAVLILESEEHLRQRGARPLAEVAGYAANSDAGAHFEQKPGGEDAIAAIQQALARASVSPDRIDYVNAHGTATIQNDSFETGVLRAALGPTADRVPVSSTKSMVGHLLGASAAFEAAATIAAMHGGFIPPTLNLDHPDPQCDLDFVPHRARPGRIEVALSTSFGFGARNAALVLRRSADERVA